MCSIWCTRTADDGFADIRRSGDDADYEGRLALLASEDSATQRKGLELQLKSLTSWHQHQTLRSVRKYRMGHRRFYIRGRHTDCRYTVCYIKVFKRTEENQEETPSFQSKVLRALSTGETRRLQP